MTSQSELEHFLLKAADILRGHMDNADFKQYIFPILFLKRICDVREEEHQAAILSSAGDETIANFEENFRFQIPKDCDWNTLQSSFTNVGSEIQRITAAIEAANPKVFTGIFGDTAWTNKDRLPDEMLRDLVNHFSTRRLTTTNVNVDQMSTAYEYLVRTFANDGGQTAKEFYTNRTVVNLMIELLQPKEHDSVYDPTCGTGGMLLNAVTYLDHKGLDSRTVRLSGQELNVTTSAICRMNLVLHGLDDFRVNRGDTLANPGFISNGQLEQFDIVLANPPYSISRWNRNAWAADEYGRNVGGLPPQGCADFAFLQHIVASLKPGGSAAVLLPHCALMRDEESKIRQHFLESDLIEGIIGLGPNLFYNSTMESIILILNKNKKPELSGKIILVDAHEEVTRKDAMSFLSDDQISSIITSYESPEDSGNSLVVSAADAMKNGSNLSLGLYIPSSRWTDFFAEPSELNVAQSRVSDAVRNMDHIIERSDALANFREQSNTWGTATLGDVMAPFKAGKQLDVDPTVAVGLEHIYPADSRLSRWADPSEFSFSKKFIDGTILFGRSRSYLRKVVIAEGTSGVCSGDIIVLAPKTDVIDLNYALNLMKSDEFTKYALKHSAGGFSPRARWESLAEFKFKLPKLEIQKEICVVLQEMATANNSISESIHNIERDVRLSYFAVSSLPGV